MKHIRRSFWRVIGVSASVLILVASMFYLLKHESPALEEKLVYAGMPDLISFDLDDIKERGKLIVLTENSSTTYYTIQEQKLGFDYELAQAFADYLNVDLEVRVVNDVDSMFAMLYRGEGDIIGCNLTKTAERLNFLAFSPTLYKTDQVLVQRIDTSNKNLEDGILMRDSLSLDRIPIHVHRYSSFSSQLNGIKSRNGQAIQIVEVNGMIGTEELIQQVSLGAIPATVTDRSLANMLQSDYVNLNMQVPISGEQEIAWALRPNAYQLQFKLEEFLNRPKSRKLLESLRANYLEKFEASADSPFATHFKMPPVSKGAISPYDSLYKKYCVIPGWDWRLMAALSYVESGFNPNVVSYAGARGLMQLMPASLKRYGCDSTSGPGDNVRAGAMLIKNIDEIFVGKIKNKETRLKFVLASYNAGPGHILDAMCIAKQIGKSDTLWEGNVAEAMLLKTQRQYYTMPCVRNGYLNGAGPVNFANKVIAIFTHYKANGK